MYTIKETYKEEIEVERSTFISYLLPCNSEEEAKEKLLTFKKENPKARHVCYAYCINGNYKGSDDGEPKGTAGRPMMEILQKKELQNVLLVVIRYFGGVLLGAGRLLRTYVEASTLVLSKAKTYEIVKCNVYQVELPIANYQLLVSYCTRNNISMRNIEFSTSIYLELCSESDIINNVVQFFNGNINITLKGEENILK